MDNFPEAYKKRPLHDDWTIPWLPTWMQPWGRIPRRWTGLCLVMPPKQIAGNAPQRWISIQPGYPLAPGLTIDEGRVWGPDPVPPAGCWTVQAFYSVRLKRWVPCYFAMSVMVLGRRLHFNGPLKPDVTKGDFFWWAEISLSWVKPKP